MRNFPQPLLDHIAGISNRIAYGLKLTRRDGNVYAFTSLDKDIVVGGVTYTSQNGIDVSSLVSTSGFAVGNMEIRTLNDGSVYTEADIYNKLWDGAEYEIIMFDYENADSTKQVETTGTVGQITIDDENLTVELRDLRQQLQQPIGSLSSKKCRSKFGATSRETGGLCRKSLAGLNSTGEILAVDDATNFQISVALTSTSHNYHWTNGSLVFTTGNNIGAELQIIFCTDSFTDTPDIEVIRELYNPVQVGDEFIIKAGCNGHADTCKNYWDNYINFQGEPNRPNQDKVLSWTKTE